MPKYVVKVLRTVRYQVELVVSADNEDDVCDKAEKLCRDGLTGLPDMHGRRGMALILGPVFIMPEPVS